MFFQHTRDGRKTILVVSDDDKILTKNNLKEIETK